MSIFNFVKTASISCVAIVGCSLTSIAQAVSPNDIKLTYSASQIQCGAGSPLINVQVDVYRNQQFIQTLSLGDSIYLTLNSPDKLNLEGKKSFFRSAIDEKNDDIINFEYHFDGASCSPTTPTEKVFAPGDTVPNQPGYEEQDPIQVVINNLKEYKELLLVELGTTNPHSSAYDLQDVVLEINYEPYSD